MSAASSANISESEQPSLDKPTASQETIVLSLDEKLLRAVGDVDFGAACEALTAGANVNYNRPISPNEDPSDQPTSPLRMILFRLSDCLLTDAEDDTLIRLAHLLLAWAAEPEPAIEIAEARYGPPRDSKELVESGRCVTALDTVYSLVVAAAAAKHRTGREEQERIFREELAKDSGDEHGRESDFE
jgi:hypothetical protein